MSAGQISERQRDILAAVVVQYVLTGNPVGSRTVSKNIAENVSAATIRNTMVDLEEMGYLFQPHTSAGRIPTDQGYRYYVDALMSDCTLNERDQQIINSALPVAGETPGVDVLLARTAHLLADLSSHVGLVLAPRFHSAIMKRLEFLQLPRNRVLAIFVSQSGIVDHKVISVPRPFGETELLNITNLINDNFTGLTLLEIRSRVLKMMSDEKALYDRLLARALELSRSYLEKREEEAEEVLVDGASNVVGEPDFEDVQRMKSLFRAFEEKSRLVEILNACLEQGRSRILIGSETRVPSLSDLTLISSPYSYREQPVGALGVIGPTRMNYDRLVILVESLSRFLSESLSRRAQADHWALSRPQPKADTGDTA
ncbi:MAG: heat-inducible transcriptional repressor HrcA [Acidobacteriota bacterium]